MHKSSFCYDDKMDVIYTLHICTYPKLHGLNNAINSISMDKLGLQWGYFSSSQPFGGPKWILSCSVVIHRSRTSSYRTLLLCISPSSCARLSCAIVPCHIQWTAMPATSDHCQLFCPIPNNSSFKSLARLLCSPSILNSPQHCQARTSSEGQAG